MRLSEKLKAIAKCADDIQEVVRALRDQLQLTKSSWPDHQIVPCFEWHTRDEVPPKGKIWASDGLSVWLVWSDGEPIGEHATSVKFWSNAYIPAPPDLQNYPQEESLRKPDHG